MLVQGKGNAISLKGKKKSGILLIHGFTSTTQSMEYLAHRFHEQGYHIELPLLRHHNTRWEDMKRANRQEWINDAQAALAHLQKRVDHIYVLGLSMGGTLALRLAQTHHNIRGLVIINHAVFLGNPAVPLIPLFSFLLPSVAAIAGDLKDPDAQELAYDRVSSKAVYQLYRLGRRVRRHLKDITQPVLMFKSREDHVLPQHNAPYTLKRLGSEKKELIWLDNSYHVATLDYDKEVIFERSLEFIQSLE